MSLRLPAHLGAVLERRHLVLFMAQRQRRQGLVGTALGQLWELINPAAQVAIYYLLVAVIFQRGGTFESGAFLTLVIGIIHYSWMSHALTDAAGSILQQEGLLLQVRIEPLVFVFSSFMKSLLGFRGPLAVLAVVYALSDPDLAPRIVAYPALLAALSLLVWAGGLVLASMSVFVRDLKFALPIVLRLLMYACPVIYTLDLVPPSVRDIYLLNPVATLFALLQWSLLGEALPSPGHIALASVVIGVLAVAAYGTYARSQTRFTKVF